MAVRVLKSFFGGTFFLLLSFPPLFLFFVVLCYSEEKISRNQYFLNILSGQGKSKIFTILCYCTFNCLIVKRINTSLPITYIG